MKPRLPKKLYRVATTSPMTRGRYWSKGGGTYHVLHQAQRRLADIRAFGGDGVIYECEPEWVEVPQ